MKCPKCSGKIIPYNPADPNSDAHCRICGLYVAGTVVIAMPAIPPISGYRVHPSARPDRQHYYATQRTLSPQAQASINRRMLTPAEKDHIRAAYHQRQSPWQIAADLNRPHTTIWNWIHRNIIEKEAIN